MDFIVLIKNSPCELFVYVTAFAGEDGFSYTDVLTPKAVAKVGQMYPVQKCKIYIQGWRDTARKGLFLRLDLPQPT